MRGFRRRSTREILNDGMRTYKKLKIIATHFRFNTLDIVISFEHGIEIEMCVRRITESHEKMCRSDTTKDLLDQQ